MDVAAGEAQQRIATAFQEAASESAPGRPSLQDRVSETMNKYNLKQVDVVRESGVNQSQLSQWLRFKHTGKLVMVRQFVFLELFFLISKLIILFIIEIICFFDPDGRKTSGLDRLARRGETPRV